MAQWEGMGDVGSARYEPALFPPCPTIRVLSYILPLSAATPPAPAFSLVESRGISEMLSTRPESRLSISLKLLPHCSSSNKNAGESTY